MEIFLIVIGVATLGLLTLLVLRQNKAAAPEAPASDPLGLDRIQELERENGLLGHRLEDSMIQASKLENQLEEARAHVQQLAVEKATIEQQNLNLEERLQQHKGELKELQERFQKEFEAIANKVMKQNTTDFQALHQKNLAHILEPFREKIEGFEKRVQETYMDSAKERASLKKEVEMLHQLNQQISTEAKNLTNALKGDNKAAGNWGEVILERVLERSGLEKGQEYETQHSDENSEGRTVRPDVVVYLPDSKHIIIDSKVSLVAYESFVNAEAEVERERFLKEHLLSLKTHIKGLSEKNYHTSARLNSPDFVLLFVPIEASFSIALQYDQELYAYAWEKKIVIVSPTTLLATLKTIASIWKQEKQTRNVLDIAEKAGTLYDKFVGFLTDMEKMGKSLEQAQTAYDSGMNKLETGRGNVIRQVEQLKKLGAKAQKSIPEHHFREEGEVPLPPTNDHPEASGQ